MAQNPRPWEKHPMNYGPPADPVRGQGQFPYLSPVSAFGNSPHFPLAAPTLHFPPSSSRAGQVTPTLHFPAANQSNQINRGLYYPSTIGEDPKLSADNNEAPIQPSNENGAKSSGKWSEEQASVLVHEWKERLDLVESSRSVEAWQMIVAAVNEAGPAKSLKQCKDKLCNLKQGYKEAKANNNKTGRGTKTSPFFDVFDEVFASRPIVTMPGVIQSATNESPASSKDPSESETDDEAVAAGTPPSGEGKRQKRAGKSGPPRKRARRNAGADDAFADVTSKILEMQNAQMKAIEQSQTRAEELMLRLEMEQRRIDEDSRRRDQEFFLRMAEILKK